MPPPSPVPGWARGDVCSERTASRRMAVRAYRRPGIPLRPALRSPGRSLRGACRWLRGQRPARSGSGGRLDGVLVGRHRWRSRLVRRLGTSLVLVLAPEGEVDPDEGLLLLLADRLVGHDGPGQVRRARRRFEDPGLDVERLG